MNKAKSDGWVTGWLKNPIVSGQFIGLSLGLANYGLYILRRPQINATMCLAVTLIGLVYTLFAVLSSREINTGLFAGVIFMLVSLVAASLTFIVCWVIIGLIKFIV